VLANGKFLERNSKVNKYLLAALAAGSMIAMAAPAAAQTVTGTVNITGSVANKCAVLPGSGSTFGGTVALGELAQADGTMATDLATRFNAAANAAQLNFRVVCNTATPTVAVDATELTTPGTPPAGYASRIDYAAHVAVSLTPTGTDTFSNDSRNAAGAATATSARIANNGGNNVSVTADTFGTAALTDLLTAGAYTGNISIVIAPGA
jgi:hypothetical protein